LKLKCDELPSNFAFKFNVRCSSAGTQVSALLIADCAAAAVQLPLIVPPAAADVDHTGRGGGAKPIGWKPGFVDTHGMPPHAPPPVSDDAGAPSGAVDATARAKTAVVVVAAAGEGQEDAAAVAALVDAVRGAVPADWTVTARRVAPAATSAALASAVRGVAAGAALVVVGAAGAGGATSAAAVVSGTAVTLVPYTHLPLELFVPETFQVLPPTCWLAGALNRKRMARLWREARGAVSRA